MFKEPGSCPGRGFELTSSRLELGALSKWLASRMLLCVLAGFYTKLQTRRKTYIQGNKSQHEEKVPSLKIL